MSPFAVGLVLLGLLIVGLAMSWRPAIVALVRRRRARQQLVSFNSTKKCTAPVKVSFLTRAGDKISFKHTKKMTKPVKISFLAKNQPPRRKDGTQR